MKRLSIVWAPQLVIAVALLLPMPALGQDAPPRDSAQALEAAQRWLALVDAGEYRMSLDTAAPLLRQMAGSVGRWREFLEMARPGWELPIQRELVESQPDPELPAAPPGDYWRFVFEVGAVAAMTETVVLGKTPTGWRVAMYGTRGAN